MEITGKIKLIKETQQVSDSFKKRELVVTTNEQYPQHILIEFSQDKCDILNNYKANDDVIVSINLRGREWINPEGEAKFFNSIQGWRINKVEEAAQPIPAQPIQQEEHDDLPF